MDPKAIEARFLNRDDPVKLAATLLRLALQLAQTRAQSGYVATRNRELRHFLAGAR